MLGGSMFLGGITIMKIREVLIRLIGAADANCPNETDVLAYAENRLSTNKHAQIERHFANCHDCLEVLAFIGREQQEAPATLTAEAVSAQADSVFAYIQRDERDRTRSTQRDERDRRISAPRVQPAGGFYVSYPRLATIGLFICAIAVAGVFLIMGKSPGADSLDDLKLAVKKERFIEPRVSGGFEHSIYKPIRGEVDRDGLHFDRAEKYATVAAQDSAVEEKLALPRVYLMRGTPANARQAAAILEQLSQPGIETHESLNDLGVAQLELRNNDAALEYFNRALAKSPGYDEALFNRALANERLSRYAEATQDWQQFINQSADEKWKDEARKHLKDLQTAGR